MTTQRNSKDVKVVTLDGAKARTTTSATDSLDHPGLIRSGAMAERQMRLSEPLELAVMRHLGRHATGSARRNRAARFLVVQGPPGSGKTSSIEKIVTDAGCHLINIAASSLASPYPGEGLAPIKDAEASARAIAAATGDPVAIKIDDFDLSVATEHPGVQREIGSLLLTNYLQGIADNAEAWPLPGGGTVAFFFTVNDAADAFRASLFRPGRADLVTHDPGRDEKTLIVATMLGIDATEAETVIDRHPAQPISWFASLRSRALDDVLDALLQRTGNDWNAIGAALAKAETSIAPADLLRVAASCKGPVTPQNFVKRTA